MYNILAYVTYLGLALVIVLLVGAVLYRNGRFFLVDVFRDEHLADTTNRLLYLGYCLVNAGMAFYQLNTISTLSSVLQVLDFVSNNTGGLLLLLGLMHILNLIVIPLIAKLFTHSTHLKN